MDVINSSPTSLPFIFISNRKKEYCCANVWVCIQKDSLSIYVVIACFL